MKDKTKEQLIAEIELLRKEVDRLKQGKAECGGVAEELHSERDKFRGILFSINAGVDIVTQDFVIEYQNEFLVQRFGDKRGEKCYVAYMHLDKPCKFCRIHEVLETGETQRIELVGGDGRDYELNSSAFVDVDGQVKVIEVVRDITERKRAEEALRESEEYVKTILDSIQSGILVVDAETHEIVDANPIAIEMFGVPKEQVVGSICHRYICPAEVGQCPITDLGQAVDNSERVLLKANGESVPILKTVTPIILNGRKCLLESFTDITEQRESRNKLEELEVLESSILSAIPHAVIGLHERRIVFANKGVEAVFGWKPEGLIGKTTKVLYRSEEEYEEIARRAYPVLERQQTCSLEFPCRHKDGREIVCMVSASRIGESLVEKKVVVTYEDTTERKKAEEEIKYQKKYFQALFESSPEAVVSLDTQNRIVDINPAFEEMFGYKLEDIKGRDIDDCILPKNKKEEGKGITKRVSQGEVVVAESVRKKADGIEMPVSILGAPITLDGKQIGVFAIYRDITERKRVEATLRESEEFLRTLFDTVLDGILILEYSGKILNYNSILAKMFDLESTNEAIGRNALEFVLSEFHNVVIKDLANVKEGRGGYLNSYKVKSMSGREFWVEGLGTDITYEGKHVDLVSIRDITERKRAEEELRRSEEKYRTTFENTGTAMAIVEADTTISLVNHQFEILASYSKEEIEGKKSWTEFVHQEDLERMKEYHRRRREPGGKAPTEYEFRFVDREGNIKNIFLTVEVISGTKKSITSLMDITERKRAEETLRESEEKYRDLADLLPQTVFEMDERGNLTFANRSAFAIFGYTQNDFDRGLNALQMFIPEDRDRAEENIQKVLSGEGKTGNEYTAQKKDGGTFPCIIYSSPIIHENKPVGLRGIIVDITERKRAEEQLEHSFIDLAETVSRAMSSRDPYTASHQRRVAELARLVGEKIGLDGDRLRGLYIGGLLHDIGKVSIPEAILSKPGKLNSDELHLVRRHTKEGYKILKDTDLPWPVADMALHHHERLDGSGYPHGISGDKLSLGNRILGVCDVVEAMSSHRPYRPARSKEEVLEEIKNGRGTKYDANVVDIMLQIIEGEEFELSGG